MTESTTKNVLIVDDSRANRMVLQKFMREFGFETIEAESGLDAVWTLKQKSGINLITVDYNMPKMTGMQFVRLVREKPELSAIPILMITSENTEERQNEAFEAGANAFIVKPFTREVIEEALIALGIEIKNAQPRAGHHPVAPSPASGDDTVSP